ncbi:unnamed protein product [Echinostoma caproni]|uniref:UBX domain-containing protein n=1 Tax=Echinostoma caproni TaxID=27848 RepID=A0A3P8HDP9_9TREM|nr:unnamed protein product [Echinostoma caproni]
MAAREAELRQAELVAAEAARQRAREQALVRAREARRVRWRHCLPPPPEANGPDTVQLSIKMPNGSRASRVFSLHDSVKILYYFVLTQDSAPEHFEVQANFPKRLVPCQPNDESDLEDYVVDDAVDQNTADSSKSTKKPKTLDPILDWTPRPDGTDPPSFNTLNLRKPEVLFIIDNDA